MICVQLLNVSSFMFSPQVDWSSFSLRVNVCACGVSKGPYGTNPHIIGKIHFFLFPFFLFNIELVWGLKLLPEKSLTFLIQATWGLERIFTAQMTFTMISGRNLRGEVINVNP